MIRQRKKLLRDLLFVFFTLFVFASTFSIAMAQVCLGLSLVLFIIVAVTTGHNPFSSQLKWFYIFVGLYIFWMLLASLFGNTPVESTLILKEEWLFCVVPIGIYLLAKEDYRRRMMYAFAIGTGLFAVYGILQFFTGVHWFKSVEPNPGPEFFYVIKGNFPSPMTFGNYFGTAAGFFAGMVLAGWSGFERKEKILFSMAAFAALLSTLGSYNRGALLGLVAAFIVLCIIIRGRKLTIAVVAAIILIIAGTVGVPSVRYRIQRHLANQLSLEYQGSRLFIWNNSLKIVAENPVLGVGQGNFRYEYEARLPEDVIGLRKHVHAHNDFINIAAIAGLPGMLFFVGIWVAVFGYLRRQWKLAGQQEWSRPLLVAATGGSVVFLVSSLTEATFADEEVRQMLMFLWAVGLFSLYPGPERAGNQPPAPE
ncbi:MAG: O-antigen ligase family protein [Candidatus Zixiibacteriota bacterium]|nr:MAG: O-antigen ligase family protein [candidate division Zixibacteria bacterium]